MRAAIRESPTLLSGRPMKSSSFLTSQRNSMLQAMLAYRFCCASESEIVLSRRVHTGKSAILRMSLETVSERYSVVPVQRADTGAPHIRQKEPLSAPLGTARIDSSRAVHLGQRLASLAGRRASAREVSGPETSRARALQTNGRGKSDCANTARGSAGNTEPRHRGMAASRLRTETRAIVIGSLSKLLRPAIKSPIRDLSDLTEASELPRCR